MLILWIFIGVVAVWSALYHHGDWKRCRQFNTTFGRNPYGGGKYEERESASLVKLIISIGLIIYCCYNIFA